MQGANTDFTGTVLGTFRLVQRIGKGGMSVVYQAEQIGLQRQVAVKILFPGVPAGSAMYQEFLERFRREARLVAGLGHNNIVSIYDYKEQKDLAYLVMPYFPRKSLAHLLDRQGPLSLQDTLAYIEQAALALDYAHARDIIHRDLKPSNFLLHEDGHLVLADFGIAYMMRSTNTGLLTRPSEVIGTPEYIAPEMILKKPLDRRVDIYEMGIVLFEMLTGHLPFNGSAIEIQMKHVQEQPPFLHHIRSDIPLAVDVVMRKATAKAPQDRYSSAGEMAAALRMAIRGNYADPPFPPTVLAYSQNGVYSPWNQTVPMEYAPLSVGSMPSSSLPRPRAKKRVWIYALAVLALFFIIGTAMLPRVTAIKPASSGNSSSAKPDTYSQIQNTVKQYYNAINKRDYHNAYQWTLHPDGDGSYCKFVDGFKFTEYDSVESLGTPKPINATTFSVPITLHATEQLQEGRRESTYQGHQNVTVEHGSWKISGGNIQPKLLGPSTPWVPSANNAPAQAQELVHLFYDNINSRDYPAAYNLRGANYRLQQSYCDFVDEYGNTKHNSVDFASTSPQPDGSMIVSVKITALETVASKNITSIYEGTYTVGIEKGGWKLQQDTLQKTESG